MKNVHAYLPFNILHWDEFDRALPIFNQAISLKEKGNLLELVDRRLESSLNKEEITRAINVALICTNVVAAERPRGERWRCKAEQLSW